jgi:hypothetical protein
MKDEEFVFRSDSRDKAITARSAKSKKTKGGRVRLPSDNLSKKELKKMSGECKSYRLNEPMTREELLAMPDDLKIAYIKAIRNKYGTPDSHLGKAMGFSQQRFAKLVNRLGIARGKAAGGHVKWDKEGFFAWWHGVDQLPTPVPEEPTEEPVIEEVPVITTEEPEVFVEDDLPVEEAVFVPVEKYMHLDAEIACLTKRIDELLMSNEELMAVHEKDKERIGWLEVRVDELGVERLMLEKQMEVVRLIFG